MKFTLYAFVAALAVLLIPLRAANALTSLTRAGAQPAPGCAVSLHFHDIDVRQALYVLSQFAGLNLVISDSVAGTLTLHLAHVHWEEALTLILRAKQLEQRRTGNILHIAPREEWLKQEKSWQEAQQQLARQQPLHSETFALRYRSVEEIRKILDERVTSADKHTSLLSERGNLVMDPKTNLLIVSDISPVLDTIRHLIDQIDRPMRQVQIEAHIVEATDTFSRDLGAKLAFARHDTKWQLQRSLDAAGHRGNEQGHMLAPNINLPIAQAFGSIASLFSAGAHTIIGLELQAMQAENKGKLISSPRILTADRTEATIEEGSQIPYPTTTGSTHTRTRVEFKPAALSLKVTPFVSRDNSIVMTIQLSKDSPNFGQIVQGSPSIDTKKLSTQVLVENGGTVVIGGIYVDEHDHTINKIPLFGDLPLLGSLFSSQRQKHLHRELLVFITPTIVADQTRAEPLAKQANEKNQTPSPSAAPAFTPLQIQ